MKYRQKDPRSLRIDFKIVDVSGDQKKLRFVAVPDPDRYEFVRLKSGQEGWFDRLDPRKIFITLDALTDGLSRAARIPVTDIRPKIEDSDAYIQARLPAISEALRSGIKDKKWRNISNEELEVPSTKHFVIISIDLVNSTALSQIIDQDAFARIIQTYSREIALMCSLFHGRVLRFAGDGAILYFPSGTMARKHDFAIDCALSLRDLVLVGMNHALRALDLPTLFCRIGVDSGDAPVVNIGDGATLNNVDIIGEIVNIAAKIEKCAPVNGICIGESVAINAHTTWLKHLVRIPGPEPQCSPDSATREPYAVYRLDMPPRGT